MKEAFKIFDKNRNGFIEAKELKEVTTSLGQFLTEEEFEEFWLEADCNNDGKLDYNEFIKIMMQYWQKEFWKKSLDSEAFRYSVFLVQKKINS